MVEQQLAAVSQDLNVAFASAATSGMRPAVGGKVYDLGGNEVGPVVSLVFDPSDGIQTVIIGVGDYLGFGRKIRRCAERRGGNPRITGSLSPRAKISCSRPTIIGTSGPLTAAAPRHRKNKITQTLEANARDHHPGDWHRGRRREEPSGLAGGATGTVRAPGPFGLRALSANLPRQSTCAERGLNISSAGSSVSGCSPLIGPADRGSSRSSGSVVSP